jgi:hypothetical protein
MFLSGKYVRSSGITKIGHTLNRDKRPEVLGWSPSRDCQARARSLSKVQTRDAGGSGKREVLSISLAQLLLARQAWQPLSAESVTIALLRAATDYNNVAM